jgi:hypothetical protein
VLLIVCANIANLLLARRHPVTRPHYRTLSVAHRQKQRAPPFPANAPGFSISAGKVQLFPFEGGEPREIAGLADEDRIAGWTADPKALFVYRTGELPARVMRLNYETGKREFVREVAPADRAGVGASYGIRMTPDGKTYAYSPTQMLHELHLVEGLK